MTSAVLAASITAAAANPFVPARGSGSATVLMRLHDANHRFKKDSYGALRSTASSEYSVQQLEFRGYRGLGQKWEFAYALRAGEASRSSNFGSDTLIGLGDQQISLLHGLASMRQFASAVGFSLVVPTAARNATVNLGRGIFAMGPLFQVGWRGRHAHRGYAYLSLRELYYSQNAGHEFRTSAVFGKRLSRWLTCTYSVSYRIASGSIDSGRSLFRNSVGLRFSTGNPWKPFVEYQADLAGRDTRQGYGLRLGLSRRY